MSSQWSSADPIRRRAFIGVMVALGAILLWVTISYITADSKPETAPSRPATGGRPPVVQSAVTPPPGHEVDDDVTPPPPVRPQQPLQVPPRYTVPPRMPVTDAELKAASDQALSFMEVFGNGRWDDKPDAKINALRPFVASGRLDVVLAQYEQIRAKEDGHESVTYQVTETRWWTIAERQATMYVAGLRQVSNDVGAATDGRQYLVNLSLDKGTWFIVSVRDASVGDIGLGPR
jgi:hypothetical protein